MRELTLRLALPVGIFVLVWQVLCVVAALVHRAAHTRLRSIEPGQRSLLLLSIALGPVVVGGLVSLLVFAPSVGGAIIDTHCHQGSCAPHPPVLSTSTLVAGITVLVVLIATSVAGAVLTQALVRTILTGKTLLGFTETSPRTFRVLDTPQPLAYCVGLLRPHVVISRGMLCQLADTSLDVVLAHERAHSERLDNLRHLLARLCCIPMPRHWRRAITDDLRLAAEQACDQEAAQRTGDALAVANTLLAVRGGLAPKSEPHVAISALCEHDLEQRVRALLEPRWSPPSRTWLLASGIVTAYVSVTVVSAEVVHHAVEAFFSVLR